MAEQGLVDKPFETVIISWRAGASCSTAGTNYTYPQPHLFETACSGPIQDYSRHKAL